MSHYTYTESSRRYYTEAPKIIQSRGSSSDSRSSSDSKRSTDPTTMGHNGESHAAVDGPTKHKFRAADAENKYVHAIRHGKVEVIQHKQRIYDPEAPLSSDATSSDYHKERRHEQRHSSHGASHTHSSHHK